MLGRELLPPEEEHRQVDTLAFALEVAYELDRDREATLHVARPEPVTAPSSIRPGRLPCAGTVS